jgi:hypothetical protein
MELGWGLEAGGWSEEDSHWKLKRVGHESARNNNELQLMALRI